MTDRAAFLVTATVAVTAAVIADYFIFKAMLGVLT